MILITKKVILKKTKTRAAKVTKATTGYTLDEIKAKWGVSIKNIEIIGNEFYGPPKWHHIPTGRTAKLNDGDMKGYMAVIERMKERMKAYHAAKATHR